MKRDIQEVKDGSYLLWPETWEPRFRGDGGYRVDLSAPFESDWCDGQEHKLQPCEAKAASTIEHPKALDAIRKFHKENAGAGRTEPEGSAVTKTIRKKAARKASARGGAIPKPDDQPTEK